MFPKIPKIYWSLLSLSKALPESKTSHKKCQISSFWVVLNSCVPHRTLGVLENS